MQKNASISNPASSDLALRAMFEARKRVFVDHLKWNVPVLDERYEIDQFDTPDAAYLVLANELSEHRASARLLRTDHAHILGQLFPVLCDGPVPRGARTREITRFCIEPTLPRQQRRLARDELVTAIAEHALGAGITDYTAVASISWFRQISSFGWHCEALGAPRVIAGETLVALHIHIDPDTPRALAETGIYRRSSYRLAQAEAVQ
jgi:acyl homoserine lactone synthase/acyl-homoserine lactone synthase